jgi:cytochrome bd ubiquinol oxidase subunit II
VWLIIVVVLLFTAFPVAFGAVSIVLHIPLTVMLVGIVMRGSAFVFRSYGSSSPAIRKRWGATFASASIATPILLGTIIGAVASGSVADASTRATSGSFVQVYVTPWLAPFPLAVGGFALALFAYLAAIYLTVEARGEGLRLDFRARALVAALLVFVFAALALLLSRSWAPRVAAGMMASPWSIPLHICTGAAAITAMTALWFKRYELARIAGAAQVSLILWGWALSQYPYILPTTLTIRQAAAPTVTLRLLLIGLAAGGVILIPSLRYLFRTFAGRAAESR